MAPLPELPELKSQLQKTVEGLEQASPEKESAAYKVAQLLKQKNAEALKNMEKLQTALQMSVSGMDESDTLGTLCSDIVSRLSSENKANTTVSADRKTAKGLIQLGEHEAEEKKDKMHTVNERLADFERLL